MVSKLSVQIIIDNKVEKIFDKLKIYYSKIYELISKQGMNFKWMRLKIYG